MKYLVAIIAVTTLDSTYGAGYLRGDDTQRNLETIDEAFLWAQEEDTDFWERELGGSHRRRATTEIDLEDVDFWERELGGSSRRRATIQETNNNAIVEETFFRNREVGNVHRRLLAAETIDEETFWERELGAVEQKIQYEDADFWERELGGSSRRRATAEIDLEGVDFWERELGGSSRRK